MLISNTDTNLGRRINKLILSSKELNFLVGFFFFSGFKEIYESLKENPEVLMKVLIGLSVDELNGKIYEIATQTKGKTADEKVKETVQNFVKALNQDDLDTKDFYEQAYFFIDMFDKDRLLIRKTLENNHAKLYIFKLKEGELIPRVAILGSSNFTKAGLETQHELNVEIRDDYTINELVKYFDNLWDKSLNLDLNSFKKEIINLVKTKTLLAEITPYEAYVLLLDLYNQLYSSDLPEGDAKIFLEKKGYKPFKYQLDAIAQAQKILEDYNGVILADVVGLGKSIIASLIARELKCRGVIIAPPALIGDEKEKTSGWAKYKEDFELWSWEIFSTGKLEQALSFVQQRPEIKAVIIDEIHRFRNENTESYKLLSLICRGKKVIMLSATPFNNRPSDIFSYLKLFTIPKKSPLSLNGDLQAKFIGLQARFDKLSEIIKKDKTNPHEAEKLFYQLFSNLFDNHSYDIKKVRNELKKIADEIRRVIEPIVIRRNRLDLKQDPEYKNEIHKLPVLHDPQEIFYYLTTKQSNFYDNVLSLFNGTNGTNQITLCIYIPQKYVEQRKEEEYHRQLNLVDLMRRLLVKRFESSFWAFGKSIDNFLNVYKNVKRFIQKTGKYVLNRQIIDEIVELEDSDEIDNKLQALIIQTNTSMDEVYEIQKLGKSFLNDIKRDIRLLKDIQNKLKTTKLIDDDPKLVALEEKLNQLLPDKDGKKVIIFTEYKDTADYLGNKLKNQFRVLVATSAITKAEYIKILENFDASLPKSKQANSYDVLIATDKFSEGLNFNRAVYIINYDIPWNPVRVIQRVGRINRIGQCEFQDLYIYNFFPTEKGAQEIRIKEIAQNKMFMIHKCLGEDAKIFSPDEEPTPSELYRKLNENPDVMGETSFITKVRALLKKIEQNDPNIITRVRSLPPRIKVAKNFLKDELIVVVKRYNQLFVKTDSCNVDQFLRFEDIFESVCALPQTKAIKLSSSFWDKYLKIKKDIFNERASQHLNENDNNLNSKAQKTIKLLLTTDIKDIEPYKDFLEKIYDDLLNYGTLPKKIITQIASWEVKTIDNEKIKKLRKEISELMKILGNQYFENIKSAAADINNQIIIAIENQKNNHGN